MKKSLTLAIAFLLILSLLTACGGNGGGNAPTNTPATENAASTPDGAYTGNETASASVFENGVLTTAQLKIEISDYKVITLDGFTFLGIWFSVTNLTDNDLTPVLAWNSRITAYQDENLERRLSLTTVPDEPLNDYLDTVIAKDDTVHSCIAYIINDTAATVTLVGSEKVGGATIGSMTLDLSGR